MQTISEQDAELIKGGLTINMPITVTPNIITDVMTQTQLGFATSIFGDAKVIQEQLGYTNNDLKSIVSGGGFGYLPVMQ